MRDDLAGGEGFLREYWYVAGRSEDFDASPTALTILGEPIVVFRGAQGEPIVLEDACPHRKLPLSRGTVSGSTVICGYHGLTFDGSGACVAAPTQPDSVPSRARVRAYPAVDRWGFVWVWTGAGTADPADIIDIPQFDNPEWGRTPKGALEMGCHYLYITDNLLDPSHVAWVHLTSFAGAGTDNRPLEIDVTEDGVTVSRWIPDEPAPPYYAAMLPFGPTCDRKQHYEMRLPSTALNLSVYTPSGEGGGHRPLSPNAFLNINYNFITPVDATRTRYFWFQHRNMHADDTALSQRMFDGAVMAFNEDKDVLERVQAGMAGRTSPYLNLGLDAGAMRFRAMVARGIAAEAAAAPRGHPDRA
ncbi:MAG: aromatic ring-hydroxylating dioxygenase subunit alpha [Rhodobacteraceae bacterium]|nr:aromatic ring-hydroxylating dioxygenase subunit alpha [Paracoccaceae bacterium]